MKLTKVIILTVICLAPSASLLANTIYEYDWVGGQAFTGKLFLDAPSSANGSAADIVSVTLNVPTIGAFLNHPLVPGFTLTQNDLIDFGSQGNPPSVFSWNSTAITSMTLGFQYGTLGGRVFSHATPPPAGFSGPINYVTTDLDPSGSVIMDGTGKWLEVAQFEVPDHAGSFLGLGFAVVGLWGYHRFQTKATQAKHFAS